MCDHFHLLNDARALAEYMEATVTGLFQRKPQPSGRELLDQAGAFVEALERAAEQLGIELTEEDYRRALELYAEGAISSAVAEHVSTSLSAPIQPSRSGAIGAPLWQR